MLITTNMAGHLSLRNIVPFLDSVKEDQYNRLMLHSAILMLEIKHSSTSHKGKNPDDQHGRVSLN